MYCRVGFIRPFCSAEAEPTISEVLSRKSEVEVEPYICCLTSVISFQHYLPLPISHFSGLPAGTGLKIKDAGFPCEPFAFPKIKNTTAPARARPAELQNMSPVPFAIRKP